MKTLIINGSNEQILEQNELDKHSSYLKEIKVYDLASDRSTAVEILHKVKEDEMAEITFDDGSSWIGGIDELPEIFDRPENRSVRQASDEWTLPNSISLEVSRGRIKDLALKFLKVFRTKVIAKSTGLIAAKIDNKNIKSEGLYHVRKDMEIGKIVDPKRLELGKRYLLFIHGTASSYNGSYGDLISNEYVGKALREFYEERILAFNHYTLTKSPVQNCIDLISSLPDQIELDVISSSRGGIIADILSRYNHTNNQIGFQADELLYLQKEFREDIKKELEVLNKAALGKKINLQRVIRVACPASGTSLLGKNLNIFFNVLRNLIRAATGGGSVVMSHIGDLIIDIIKLKDDPNVLPGLEAMTPKSPLLYLLNQKKYKTNTSISYVSANSNIKGGFLKGAAFVLTRLIMWKKNDFVVDTHSMLQGVQRSLSNRAYEVKNNEIHHLSYFKDERFTNSIVHELSGEHNKSIFADVSIETPLSASTSRGTLGIPGGKYSSENISYQKPLIILIPGIMGSGLSEVKKGSQNTIWFDLEIIGNIERVAIDKTLKATHVIKSAYKKFGEYLRENGYDVLTFPYDWRLPIADSGKALAKKIDEILKVNNFDQPIKIIAHSMGGLVVRDVMINHASIYEKLNSREDFKLLLLGTPWKGSLLILELLLGFGERFSAFKKISLFQSDYEMLSIFSRLPGAIQLLPLTDGNQDFTTLSNWDNLKKSYNKDNWVIPLKKDIEDFYDFKQKFLGADLDMSNAIYIAGKDKCTANHYKISNNKKDITFFGTPEGDGSVTWDLGIPEGTNTYYIDVAHGELANSKKHFDGLRELVEQGYTQNSRFYKDGSILLQKKRDLYQEDKIELVRHHIIPNDKVEIANSLLGLESLENNKNEQEVSSLHIRVSMGDLSKADNHVMVGRFTDEGLWGAEKAIDNNLYNDLNKLDVLGIYPNKIYSNKIISNRHSKNKLFKGGIIVGMGDKSEITPFTLQNAVAKGVLEYVMHCLLKRKDEEHTLELGLSTVVMASVYGKLDTETALESIIRGVIDANDRLIYRRVDATVNELEIIELFKEKSNEIFQNVKNLDASLKELANITIGKKIKVKDGWLRKIPDQYRFSWYNRYTITMKADNINSVAGYEPMVFKADTGAARQEEAITYGSTELIRGLNSRAKESNWDPKLNKALFEYLIPSEFKNIFKRETNIELVLDETTANFPWELMISELDDRDPIAINASIIRRFNSENFTINPSYVTKDRAYIIGNPHTKYSDLPGAYSETLAVSNILKENDYELDFAEQNRSKLGHMVSLLADQFKIIHIAAHGIYDDEDENEPIAKIIIGPHDRDVLTAYDFKKMSKTPELVFINCCHLGRVDEPVDKKTYEDRFKLAPSIARNLIEFGCKAVIVGGWAVNDRAAKIFAETFYSEMFNGETFGIAVNKARRECYSSSDSNTWGAYQCYGSAHYKLRDNTNKKSVSNDFLFPEQAEVELRQLLNEIQFGKKPKTEFLERLEGISNRITSSSLRNNFVVAELEARCYSELDAFDKAIEKYEVIKNSKNSNVSFKIHEQYHNLSIRNLIKSSKGKAEKIKRIDSHIKELKDLFNITPSYHTLAMLGSAHQRKLLVEWDKTTLKKMANSYMESFHKLKENPSYNDYNYPLFLYLKANYFMDQEKKKLDDKIIKKLGVKKVKNFSSLKNLLEQEISNPSRQGFWNEISYMAFNQYKLLYSSKKEVNKILDNMIQHFDNAWVFGGTYRQKSTEIDHIDFLIAGLKNVKIEAAEEKVDAFVKLKRHIENQV